MNFSIHGDADLHLHTTHSDGYFSPIQLIDKVHALGLRAVAIVDHDEISAISEAIHYGYSKGIEVLPGVELSISFNGQDVHILGYCFDFEDANLIRYLSLFREERLKRARSIVNKLAQEGLSIHFDDVMEKAGSGSVGRPHVANVLLEHGYVKSFQQAFDKYLGDGKPANIRKYSIDFETAQDLIHSAGGVCSIAHPGIQLSDRDVMTLIKLGVPCLEAVHPKHRAEKTRFYRNLAENHGLQITGGSDFHGGTKGEETLGKYTVPYQTVAELKKLTGYITQV